ncbi:copper-binding protein [Ideonella alba]|uniref:Copper-binding protein n=1 Tax=Ideonella alba TaxID=2824118 RepID=A0A941BCW8_9BURK|nr:copper-binding protein [Ideonella alba]MBQ0932370.1 copper-binding protein [Ideonella alba]
MTFAPTLVATLFATLAVTAAPAQAQTPTDPSTRPAPAVSAAPEPTSDGEVRKVDKAQGKLTLKHGPIKNLDMPPMTMVFKVSDPQLLEGLNPGDKIRFAADNLNGAMTVTAVQVLK